MDVFVALEERIGRLIEAYRALETRVRQLEEENAALRAGSEGSREMQERVERLEQERAEMRARLERVLGTLSTLEL